MKFQKIKIDLIYKAVLGETGSCMPLKFPDVGIQPDRLAQIKGIAHLVQCLEDLVSSCIITVVADSDVF